MPLGPVRFFENYEICILSALPGQVEFGKAQYIWAIERAGGTVVDVFGKIDFSFILRIKS